MQVESYPETYSLEEIKTSSENETETKLDQTIKRIIEKEGFISYTIDKRSVSTNGGNYLGILYEIDVKGTTKDGDKELNIFIKNIIDGDIKIISVSDIYNTEMFTYKELAKLFDKLQEDANIPSEERYKMVKVYDESNTETIIMENVTKKGFTTYHRMDVVPLKFMELAVKQLAKLNGLSFVIQQTMPEYFNKNLKPMKYPIIYKEDWRKMVKGVREAAIHFIDEEFKERIDKMYETLAETFAEYSNDESIKVCLCHGDYRPNNIMTKIDDGEVQELIPVDYQLLHYGCPVFDLLYLIYCCTDRSFRKEHLSSLKNLYYETLNIFLGYFNLDADTVYPREEFEKVFRAKLDRGLMYAMMFLPFIFASETEVPDLTQEFSDTSMHIDDRFRDRFRGVIEDYVEWGYL